MTAIEENPVQTLTHPLDRLTEPEIHAAREILESAGIATGTTRYVYVGLE